GFVEASDSVDVDVDRLLEGVDIVRAQLSSLGIGGAGLSTAAESTPAVVSGRPSDGLSSPPPAAAAPVGASRDSELFVRVEASRLEGLMDLLAELVMLRNRRDTYVDSLRSLNEEMVQCSTRTRTLATMADLATPMPLAPDTPPAALDIASEGDRLSAKGRLLTRSLDELSKDTGELGRSLLEVCDPLANDNAAVSHLIGRFRQELMELRRQPIGGLFQRLQRSIRDAAKAEGKQVEVEFEGRGARADRSVQERLYEPLLHLVRNAVSHGIRLPDQRTAEGKPAMGRITLAGWSDAASLWIEVRDDGAGLDTEKIAARGLELGLLSKSDAEDPAQVWKLIFHPGFSTRSTVSEISGRGVGMDVVDTWVKRLRGRIDVESELGSGTTFRLQIPLRSAVEHAMIVRSGDQLFALPMHAVSGTSDSRVPLNGITETSDRDVVPFSSLIGCRDEQGGGQCRVALRHTSPGQRLGLSDRHEEITISVDGIVGVEEVVVRSLPSLLQRNQLFAGVTLSGRGETVLLVDVARVVELNYCPDAGRSRPISGQSHPLETVPDSHETLLVVDDSVVVRRTLQRRLTQQGYRVIAATNGREALDMLKAESVMAVVTDLDMPAMNGLELIQELRRDDQLKHLPVMVVSSRDRHTLPPQLENLAAVSVLSKPVNDATISAIVQSLNSDLFPQLSDNLTSRR
ncbi:MAG: response regulator, partial [Planctomycetaceae bacterium]|nr:response regulator [Planctomycetaceae bacterium]